VQVYGPGTGAQRGGGAHRLLRGTDRQRGMFLRRPRPVDRHLQEHAGDPRAEIGVWALILIIVAWIVCTVAGGLSTPGPRVVADSGAAPVVRQ
jgi:hypothetical protein